MPDEFDEQNAPEKDQLDTPEKKNVYSSSSNPYGETAEGPVEAPEPETEITPAPPVLPPARRSPPPPPTEEKEEEDEEEEGMLRMSFMEHLEELRARILKALMGLAVA